jgi:hypothetical protein
MRYCVITFVLVVQNLATAQVAKDLPPELVKSFMENVEPIRLIRNNRVRYELDIVPEQAMKLDRMHEEHRAALMIQSEAAEKIDDPNERAKFTRESEAGNNAKSMEILRDILLPNQLKRLDQIVLRTKVERFGLPILADEPAIQHLGFPKETFDKLEEVMQQADAERTATMDAARKVYAEANRAAEQKYAEAVMGVLTPTQRKALDEMLGPPLKTRDRRVQESGGLP